MKIDYEVVKIKGVKKGKCIKCGKYTARQKIFWQTLNPFNKNKKGFPKTRDEILLDLLIERDEWGNTIICSKCEEKESQDE